MGKVGLPACIHVLIVFHVVAAGDVVHPILVIEIPADSFLDALFELETGLPSEFTLQFRAVDGVAHIVSGAVGDIGDEIHVGTFGPTQQAVDGVDDHLDDVDILPLVETADVVGLGNLALVENEVDGTGVVFDIKPVAHVFALAVDGQWLAVTDVVDKERNELLGELIGTVVVRAVGDDGGQAVGVVEGAHEVVARGFGCAIRAMGLVFKVFGEEFLAVGQMVLATRSQQALAACSRLRVPITLVCAKVKGSLMLRST